MASCLSETQAPAKPRRRSDVVCQAAGDETLLYDPIGDTVHVLNSTALAVWELCDGLHTPAEIEAALRVRFTGTEGLDLSGDVQTTLARFQAEGLLAGLDE